MNRRGTDKVLSVYWFTILIITTVAIVAAVSIFYSSKYDVRGVEGGFLGDKVSDCISKGGKLNYALDGKQLTSDNFMSVCGLNFENQQHDLFVEVSFYDFNSCNLEDRKCSTLLNNGATVKTLDVSWISQCNLDSKSPVCKEKWFYVLQDNPGKEQTKIMVKIFTGVNKAVENVN